jgi:hypothetical protein
MKVTKTEALYLHDQVADGDHPRLGKFEVNRTLPGQNIIVNIMGGKKKGWYWVDLRNIVDCIFDAVENDTFEIEGKAPAPKGTGPCG